MCVMSWAPSAFSLWTWNKGALYTTHTNVYQFTRWSSFLDWSKFSPRVDRQRVRNKLNKVFLHKLHLKCIKMSIIVVINDNNNFAPSIFRSLCEFVSDCFGHWCFSPGATLLQKNTSVQINHLQFHTMTSKTMVHNYHCLNAEQVKR